MTRRFEMIEGSASKFWQVKVDGNSFTVTYGKIGTAGTSKTTACAGDAAAQSEADKLIREKTKKGYNEIGAAGAPVAENWRPPAGISHHKHIERFLNYKVAGFNPNADGEESESGRRELTKLRDLDKLAFRVGTTEDSDDGFDARVDALLADPKLDQLRALVVGGWWEEVCENGPELLLKKLIANAARLTSLKGLFVGDVIQEENEISWLNQCDYGPVLNALTTLEEFVIRTGPKLRFKKLAHKNLRSLTVQSGGLSKEAVSDIASANLPALRVLTLWLGVDDYGGNSTVKDLEPILSGKAFPQLEHLGLQDSDNADEIAKAVANSKILNTLKGLDLSMGTMTDVGGEALLAAPAIGKLKHLNLRWHYMSPAVMKRFVALGHSPDSNKANKTGEAISVDVSDRQDGDEDERYSQVTE